MTNFPILKENSSKFDKYRTSKEGVLPETIVQERKGVSKEIWISGKDGRISCHIESPSSFLKFDVPRQGHYNHPEQILLQRYR